MAKLFVVGFGPGDPQSMTAACKSALEEADVIIGYTKYIELLRPVIPGKSTIDTPMMKEKERCREALEAASNGQTAALVCSGDAGVYGMAGLVLELSPEYPLAEIEIIPGVTAALAGAAKLGAPLTNDFAVISLSDLLTPRALIEKRLLCAAMGDFCIALYNPQSKKRADYLQKACGLLLMYRGPETVCGLVRNIGRDGESMEITTLGELGSAGTDMFTTVFIGNAQTKVIGGRMVTPRGYRLD